MSDELDTMRKCGEYHIQGHDPNKPPLDVREIKNHLGNKETVARYPLDLERVTVRPAPGRCINQVIVEVGGSAAQVDFNVLLRAIDAAVSITREYRR